MRVSPYLLYEAGSSEVLVRLLSGDSSRKPVQ